MHVRLFSDALETAARDDSEGLVGSSGPRSRSMIRCFSLAKESPVPASPKAGGGRSSSDDLTTAVSRSVR
jgi:hypothetical protein